MFLKEILTIPHLIFLFLFFPSALKHPCCLSAYFPQWRRVSLSATIAVNKKQGAKIRARVAQASPVVPGGDILVTGPFSYLAGAAAAVSSFPPAATPQPKEADELRTPAGFPASVSLLASISALLPCHLVS